MTLATRCTACGTAFRVVQDQLKVANGWVRCGRCSHVFDASDALFVSDGSATVGTEAPGQSTSLGEAMVVAPSIRPEDAAPIVGEGADTLDAEVVPNQVDALAPSELSHDAASALIDEPELSPAPAPSSLPEPVSETWPEPPRWLLASSVATPSVVDIGSVAPATGTAPESAHTGRHDASDDDDDDDRVPPDFVDARFNEDLLAGLPGLRDPAEGHDGAGLHDQTGLAAPFDTRLDAVHADSHPEPSTPTLSDAAEPVPHQVDGTALDDSAHAGDEAAPAFLRRRGRDDQRWQRTPVRIALAGCAALLVMMLGLQSALHWRDALAARWPVAAPWLSAVCASAGCRVQPLRRIDDLGVDSTTLTPALPDSAALRLGIVLSNRGDLPLAAPSVELALTDASGELVARKVLTPADFHHTAGLLQPGATTRWQTVLLASGERVVGYTVELFYP